MNTILVVSVPKHAAAWLIILRNSTPRGSRTLNVPSVVNEANCSKFAFVGRGNITDTHLTSSTTKLSSEQQALYNILSDGEKVIYDINSQYDDMGDKVDEVWNRLRGNEKFRKEYAKSLSEIVDLTELYNYIGEWVKENLCSCTDQDVQIYPENSVFPIAEY